MSRASAYPSFYGATSQSNTFSGNTLSGNTLSGNTISGNTLSGNTLFGNAFSGNTRSLTRVGILLGIGGFSLAVYLGYRYWMKRQRSESIENVSNNSESIGMKASEENATPKVILHQCPRGYTLPCISPFPLKLETFLRVAGIPYEVSVDLNTDSEARNPWLTLGNEMVYDSHECIPLLCKTFDINLEKDAKASRLTASRLVGVMMENHIYWGITLWRWVYDKGASLSLIQPYSPEPASQAIAEIAESVRRASFYAGLGRLTFQKIVDIITNDLSDLSAALGKHPFFLGEKPGEIDCTAFSMLAQILWSMPNSPFEVQLKYHDNLCGFVYRMRETYWENWEEILSQPIDNGTLAMVPGSLFYPVSEFKARMSRMSLEGAEQDFDLEYEPRLLSRSMVSSRTSIAGDSTAASRSRSRKSVVHFDENVPSTQESEASLSTEPEDVQQHTKQFDNFNQLKNIQDLLDQLNQKLENTKTLEEDASVGPTQSQPFEPVITDSNLNQLRNIEALLDKLSQNQDKMSEKEQSQDERVPSQHQAQRQRGGQNQYQNTSPQVQEQFLNQVPIQAQGQFPQQHYENLQYVQAPLAQSRPVYYQNMNMGALARPDLEMTMGGQVPMAYAPHAPLYYSDMNVQQMPVQPPVLPVQHQYYPYYRK